jgi:hypothetical protein
MKEVIYGKYKSEKPSHGIVEGVVNSKQNAYVK